MNAIYSSQLSTVDTLRPSSHLGDNPFCSGVIPRCSFLTVLPTAKLQNPYAVYFYSMMTVKGSAMDKLEP